jgi:hypothetical protein
VANNSTLTNTATVRSTDGNTKNATDTTLVQNQNIYVPPTYYPPYTPPTYYPPVQPPTYYPPIQQPPVTYPQPPVYYPTDGKPYVLPITGTKDGNLYAKATDSSTLNAVTETPAEKPDMSAAVFYATFLALLAAGSAAASKFLTGGMFF